MVSTEVLTLPLARAFRKLLTFKPIVASPLPKVNIFCIRLHFCLPDCDQIPRPAPSRFSPKAPQPWKSSVLLFLPPEKHRLFREPVLIVRGISRKYLSLGLAHGAFHSPLPLGRLVIGVGLAVVFKGRRVDVFKLLFRITWFGNALYNRVKSCRQFQPFKPAPVP